MILQLILSVFLLNATPQDTRRTLDPKLVPTSGVTTKAFIPKGWKAQDEQAGDLNGDGAPDAVLQLIEDKPERDAKDEFQERSRALLILFKTADGKFSRAAVASKLLQCGGCGGMLGGTGESAGADVKIEKGVLIVSQLSGARDAMDHLQRFRYDAPAQKFRLIGEDLTNFDRATGASETISTNFLTGKQITERRKMNPKTEKEIVVSKQVKVVAKSNKTIEQVDFEQ
jgi:hypothetical protein